MCRRGRRARRGSSHEHAIPVLQLHVIQGGLGGHLSVRSKSSLSSADDDVEPDGRDGHCCADDGEYEHTLIGSADADTGRGSPVGFRAGCQDCFRHAPA